MPDVRVNVTPDPPIKVTAVGDAVRVTVLLGQPGGGGGGGSVDWGDIGGTLSAQTDLQNALDAKAGFADPNADRIVFWDDSAGGWAALQVTSPLAISGTSLQIAGASTGNQGVVQLASDAAAQAMSSTTHALTPSNLPAVAVSAATANRIIRRDANGRAQVADPSADADIATKKYVDDNAGGGGGGVPLAIIPKVGHYLMPNFDSINTSTLGPESSSGLSWGAPILVADEIEIDQISFNVTTADASANAKVLLYAPDAYGYPSTLAVDSGGVSIASTGQKDAGFSPVTLTPGIYWGFIRSTSASSARFTSGNSFTLQSFGSDFFSPTTGRGSSMRADVGTYASPTTTLSSFSYGNPSNVQCLWFGIRRSA